MKRVKMMILSAQTPELTIASSEWSGGSKRDGKQSLAGGGRLE